MANRDLEGQKIKNVNDGDRNFTFPFIFWSVSDCFHVPTFETGTHSGKERNPTRDIPKAAIGPVPSFVHYSVPAGDGIEIRPSMTSIDPRSKKGRYLIVSMDSFGNDCGPMVADHPGHRLVQTGTENWRTRYRIERDDIVA